MVDASLAAQQELSLCCLRLRESLQFSPQVYGGETFVHVELPESAQFFRIGYAEYVFLSLLDGNTRLPQALALLAQQLGPQSLTEEQALELMKWLLTHDLAVICSSDSSAGQSLNAPSKQSIASERSRSPSKASTESRKTNAWFSKLKRLNPFWLKIPLGSPDSLIQKIRPAFRGLFQPGVFLVSWVGILAASFTLTAHWKAFRNDAKVIFDPHHWLWMLVAWAVLKIIHEFAHGLACRHFGGEVRKAGLIFVLFAPMAFVDVTSSWRFTSRWRRIAVAGAGMYAELCIAALCVFLWRTTQSEWISYHLVNVIVMAGFSTVVFNINPLMRFDGYFIFSDLLQIPNLYSQGSHSVSRDLNWLFYGEHRTDRLPTLQHAHRVIRVYGYLALVWRILICVGLVITASALWHGLGIVLAVFGVAVWFGQPLRNIVSQFRLRASRMPGQALRAASALSILAACLIGCWWFVPNPFSAQAPCVVELPESANVRVKAEGFLSDVFVQDGQWVTRGQKLIRLENPTLLSTIRERRAELEQTIAQERTALQESDPNAADLARAAQIAIRKELHELESRSQHLMLTAPTDGQVVARELKNQLGRFLEIGDPIIKINTASSKEVHLAIDADFALALRRSPASAEKLTLRLGSRPLGYATLIRVEPRAKKAVSNEKLIAPFGGPIRVRESKNAVNARDSEKEFEYIEPRFHAVAKITSPLAEKLHAGERGIALLASHHDTLGRWAFYQAQDWIRDRFALAQNTSQ